MIEYLYVSSDDIIDGDVEAAIHDLLSQCGLHMLSRDEVRCIATDSDTGLVVGVLWVGDYGDSTTWSMCVAENYRNKGIGREMYFEVVPSIESEKLDYGEPHDMVAELVAPYTLEKFVISNGYTLREETQGYRIYHKALNIESSDEPMMESESTHIDKPIFDELKKMYKEHLVGGVGDGRNPDEFDQEQLYMGVLVEIEHTDNPMIAMEIAIDHLSEIPDYYIRLQAMEDAANSESMIESMDDDYRGEHTAPTAQDSPLYDVTLNGGYPADIYDPMGYHYYGEGDVAMDKASIAIMHYCHHKPNAIVTIYRAVPVDKKLKAKIRELKALVAYYINYGFFPIKDGVVKSYKAKYWNDDVGYEKDYEQKVRDDIRKDIEKLEAADTKIKINSGDWVTINKKYAMEHGQHALNGNYKILSKRVPAKCVFTDANSLHEFGYWEVGKNSYNNVMEANQNPWYPKHEYTKPESFKEQAVMAIISMFKAMTEVHKKEFLKRVTGVSKWQLMEYDDNYIMRLKEAAKDIRDGEKDIAYWNARDARLRKQNNSKAAMTAYEHQRREAAKAKADHEAEMKLFRDLGYLDEDGKFIAQ